MKLEKYLTKRRKSIKVLSQGAALRFLLTRVFDYINIVDGAVVKIKDPIEYLKRLEFHKNAKVLRIILFKMKYKIYTDGACSGNPGPGGWAAIILVNNEIKEMFLEVKKIQPTIKWNF